MLAQAGEEGSSVIFELFISIVSIIWTICLGLLLLTNYFWILVKSQLLTPAETILVERTLFSGIINKVMTNVDMSQMFSLTNFGRITHILLAVLFGFDGFFLHQFDDSYLEIGGKEKEKKVFKDLQISYFLSSAHRLVIPPQCRSKYANKSLRKL